MSIQPFRVGYVEIDLDHKTNSINKMKTTLLKIFRKRFEIVKFGENSFALLDHKDERIIYHKCDHKPLVTLQETILEGARRAITTYEFQRFITTRRKRMYRLHLTKR